ncbi:hypothetical protein [Phycicoccus avicenniae]|uniref:hypothetical protein n=1 Tax=Phycicoccus avicenniae TaxID=2828860 RepID=UPI003D2CC2AD
MERFAVIYRYGQRWNSRRAHPVDEIDEDTARAWFEAKEPWFSVTALDTPESRVPRYTLEIAPAKAFVRVHTYYPSGSLLAGHDYDGGHDPHGQRMFLETATFYSYPDIATLYNRTDMSAKVQYRTRPDGYVRVGAYRADTRREEVTEYRDVPVDDLWVPALTEFGDWDRFEVAPGAAPGPATKTG